MPCMDASSCDGAHLGPRLSESSQLRAVNIQLERMTCRTTGIDQLLCSQARGVFNICCLLPSRQGIFILLPHSRLSSMGLGSGFPWTVQWPTQHSMLLRK